MRPLARVSVCADVALVILLLTLRHFSPNALSEFFAMHGHLLRSLDFDQYLLVTNTQHRHCDLVVNIDAFTYFPSKTKQILNPILVVSQREIQVPMCES
jgi:hypothetical protein